MTTCIYRSVTLAPGEVFSLPPNATILGIDDVNNVTSNCTTILNNLEDMKCYSMTWSVNEDRSPSPSLEANEYSLTFIVDNVEYEIINELTPGGIQVWLMNAVPIANALPPGIITSPVLINTDTGDRHAAYFTFSTVPSIAAVMKVKIVSPGYEGGLYVFPVEITC